MDRNKSKKNLKTYIDKFPEKVGDISQSLVFSGIGGRICYSKELCKYEDQLNEGLLNYLDKLSNFKHYSVFSHTPVVVDITPELYFSLGLYNLFKQYYDIKKEKLYLNLRHVMEAYDEPLTEVVKKVWPAVYAGNYRKASQLKEDLTKDLIIFDVGDYWKVVILNKIDRVVSHQIVRHQSLNFNQQSQRYVKFKKEDLTLNQYICDSFIEVLQKLSKAGKIKDKDYYEIQRIFISSIKSSYESYTELLKRGIPAETARFVLPGATRTNLILSGFKEDVNKFIRDRISREAQPEIRKIANKIKEGE